MIEEILRKHLPELTAIRRDIHAHPEMLFQEERTAAIVARELSRLGFTVTAGIARTGVVGTISTTICDPRLCSKAVSLRSSC